MKKLIPSLCMLLISAAMLSTSTYAWFSMNEQVTATGMQVKAQSEGGIVISNESKSEWTNSATASHPAVANLIPTSTEDVDAWYHNISDDANNSKSNQDADTYTEFKETVTDGVAVVTIGEENKNIYLLNKFYIKSSAEEFTVEDGLLINDVTVSGTGTSSVLDASLRVAINIGGEVYIYAPVTGAVATYKVAGAEEAITVKTTDKNVATTVTTIPSINTTTPIEAEIYIYFEGEDPSCKSANITATLDTLQVSVRFGTVSVA